MKKFAFIFLILFLRLSLFSQDTVYVHEILKRLCSSDMEGRGYVAAGDKKAAFYIQEEFNKLGLHAFDSAQERSGDWIKDFIQPFEISINTFPDDIVVKFDKKNLLKPGTDYVPEPSTAAIPNLTTYQVVRLEKKYVQNQSAFEKFLYMDFTKTCIVIDQDQFKNEIKANNVFYKRVLRNEMKADLVIILEPVKLTFGASQIEDNFPTLHIMKNKFPATAKFIMVQMPTTFVPNYQTQNVVGMVTGKKHPDSIILIGAHYDHLGRLTPNVFFEGANDNASGVAMMLDLAKYYADPFNTPDYSIAFIAFGGEEPGLLGSEYFTEHPLFPLNKISFMINLDLEGTGEKGMMVVNATKHRSQFTSIKNINAKKKYLTDVQFRGPAANSDHYPFEEKGVPAFYIYLMGNYPFYHDINDRVEKLPLGGYVGTFKLITDFLTFLQK
jgi:aminopeptidase YwaD